MLNRKSFLVVCVFLLAAQCAAAHEAAPVAKQAKPAPQAGKKSPLPARKDGLWEITVRSDELALKRAGQAPQRPLTVQQCTSADTEPVMLLSLLPGQESCRNVKVGRRSKSAGGGYDISTTCYVHDSRNDARVELQGDLQAAYSGAYQVKFSQAPLSNTGRNVFEGRWLGACLPGQRPGDMVLPNGVTVNVVDDRKRAEAQGHEGHDHSGHDHAPGHKH